MRLPCLLGVSFSGLVSGNYQIDLFNDTEEELSLLKAMDRVRNRFGAGAVMRGSCVIKKKAPRQNEVLP